MQGEKQYKTGLDVGSTTAKIVIIDESGQTVFSRYERHNAQVNDLLSAYFREARQELGNIETSIAVTGSVGMGTAEQLRTEFIQEVVAATRYAQQLYPSASALIDIGGEDAKVVLFQGNHIDLRMNGNCAGGTGAFIDQMAVLLGVDIEELSRLALQALPAVGGGNGNRLCHWVGRGAWHLPDHPLRQIRSDLQASLQCLRQLLPKRQGRSDHRHQWRPAAHGGEV